MTKNAWLKTIYRSIFPDYLFELIKIIDYPKSLLDVGCGSDSPVQALPKDIYTVGIDSFEPSINKSKDKGIHKLYVLDNVLNVNQHFGPRSFEIVLALDLIEHLEKEDATKLISKLEKIATSQVVLFTPNGFLPQGEFNNNVYQIHKSGFTVSDLTNLGYKITGINGLKSLRTEFARLKYKPTWFWRIISDLSQRYTRSHPELAFQLLAVKKIPR